MNTFSIAVDDLVLTADVSHGGFATLSMTARTQIGNIGWKGWGSRFALAPNAVSSMAFKARRCVGIILGKKLAMDSLLVIFRNFSVTGSAVHFLLG
jgi:hypothetical protein